MLDKITTTTIHNSMQMELRDYFATMVIQSLILIDDEDSEVKTAEQAYKQADAMLAARKQTDTTQGTP